MGCQIQVYNYNLNYLIIYDLSPCGKALATAGQDCIVRVWILKNYLNYFTNKRREYNKDQDLDGEEVFPSQSDDLFGRNSGERVKRFAYFLYRFCNIMF